MKKFFRNKTIHKDAIIYSGAIIRDGAMIFGGAIICGGAIIYKGAIIHNHAIIHSDAAIGRCAIVGDGAVIRDGAIIGDGATISKGVIVDKGAEIGFNRKNVNTVKVFYGFGTTQKLTAYKCDDGLIISIGCMNEYKGYSLQETRECIARKYPITHEYFKLLDFIEILYK